MHILQYFSIHLFYISALILNPDKKLKQLGISALFGRSTKYIRSFLNKTVDFYKLFLKLIGILNIDLAKGYFSIDDTSYCKPFARKLKFLSTLFDHGTKGYSKGYQVVLLCWSNGKIILPISFKIWHKELGKTKIELALELIKYAREISKDKNLGFRMDSFYSAKKLLGYLHKNHIFFAVRLAKSRTVLLNGILTKIKSTQISGKVVNVWLPAVGKVWITRYKGKYYCFNGCPEYSKQLYEWYAERWCVETVFRFIKSELHLQDCQGFKFIQHHNHIGYCFLAYGLLRGAFPYMNPYDAKRRFESLYITKTVTLNLEVFMMCA
jgi:hypothetical protein